MQRKLTRVVLGALVALVVFSMLLLFVPPAALHAPQPQWTVVPGTDNAWHDYHKLAAIVHQAAAGLPDDPARLEPDHRARLQKLEPQWQALLLAVKKPHSQRFYKPPVVDPYTPTYGYAPERTLARMALLHASEQARQGRLQPALDLELAVYHLGTDLAEPCADLTPILAGAQIRRWAATALLELLGKSALTAAQAQQIQEQLAQGTTRLPEPAQAAAWDREALERGLEEILAGTNQSAGRSPLAWFRGMRTRMVNSVLSRLEAQGQLLKPALESWDVKKVDLAQQAAGAPAVREGGGLEPGAVLTRDLIPAQSASLSQATRQLYLDRALGAGLQCLAACVVYQRQHGHYPARLQEAIAQPPLDPLTGQAPAYRLEAGHPIVWLVGPDGQDDHGKRAVEAQEKNDQGADVILRL